ncbi:uncharacterized protein DEA37_0014110 [Paragonimus westermani]|uniref:Uncharacterized protein n=1 Tax=Paragonimus westermani TaxID=34504 RepID=A0A5J4NMR5_9TREM|nr:uncharacterized protein DEA37_0014110 [Paragonimus westermani]
MHFDFRNTQSSHELLSTGSSHSGKNTISKQLRIHYGDGFPPNARLQLAPTVLANLADSVALVLRNMPGLNIHFTDTSVKRIAMRMLEAQPENGFISTMLCSSTVSQLPQLFDWPKSRQDSSTPVNTFNASFKQPDFSASIETPFESDKIYNPLTQVSVIKNSLANNDIAHSIEITKPTNQSSDDEQSCLEETLLRILQNNESVPPSLMKKFELQADSEILDELQQAFLDTQQLRSLYLQLTRHKADGLPTGLLRNRPPPIPDTPPPLTFEDELLDCIVGQNETRLSSSGESSSLSSIESEQLEEQTKVQVNHDHSKLRTNRREDKLLKTCASEMQTAGKNMECFDYEKQICINQTGENSVDHALSLDLSVGRLWPFSDAGSFHQLRMLRRILKIVTEQPEFQLAMQKSKYFIPKISYADT